MSTAPAQKGGKSTRREKKGKGGRGGGGKGGGKGGVKKAENPKEAAGEAAVASSELQASDAVAASTATAKAEPEKSLYTKEVNKKARNLRKLLVSAKSLFAPFHMPWVGWQLLAKVFTICESLLARMKDRHSFLFRSRTVHPLLARVPPILAVFKSLSVGARSPWHAATACFCPKRKGTFSLSRSIFR
jgi:hypothetical protein